MISDDNYLNIQGWMITRLGLSGNKLMAYALIYGFSQAKGGIYRGSYKYIAEWLNASERTAIRVIDELVTDGLIKKTQITVNGATYNEYEAVVPTQSVGQAKPKEKKERKPRESLKDKEPVNDLERVGKRYLENCEKLHTGGKLQTAEPCVNWSKAMALIKGHLSERPLDIVYTVLDRAMSDDWVVTNGYILTTILSANVFSRIMNSKPKGVGVGTGKDEYTGGLDF